MARQTIPDRFLFASPRLGEDLWPTVRRLPRGTGIVIPFDLDSRTARRLRREARRRGLRLFEESRGQTARIHRAADFLKLDRRSGFIFISPLAPTRSHPGSPALERMRASALIRLSPVPALALGGLDERSFRRFEPLGFQGFGAIDAWIRT